MIRWGYAWGFCYSGDDSGWSGWQARQGVQPESVAAASVVRSRSFSPMNRMRMQSAVWYLGTPGTTVTSIWGSAVIDGASAGAAGSGSAPVAAGATASGSSWVSATATSWASLPPVSAPSTSWSRASPTARSPRSSGRAESSGSAVGALTAGSAAAVPGTSARSTGVNGAGGSMATSAVLGTSASVGSAGA